MSLKLKTDQIFSAIQKLLTKLNSSNVNIAAIGL